MIHIDEKNLLLFARKLLRIPSPSGKEKEIAKAVAAEMRVFGV